MRYFFIDTNNFISCALLEETSHSPETIEKLCDVIDSNNLKLLLPEIVELEFYREVDSNYYKIKKAVSILIKNFTDNFPSILNKDKSDFIKSAEDILKKRNAAKIIAKQKIKSLFDSKNTIRIKLNSDIFINAFKRAMAGKKPYKYSYCAECKELKNLVDSDCLIFESLLYELGKLNGKGELLFCTNNFKDFAEYDEKNKTHKLIQELRNDLPKGISEKYYLHFAFALNSEFSAKIKKSDIKEIEKISNSISFKNVSDHIVSVLNDRNFADSYDISKIFKNTDSLERLKLAQSNLLDSINNRQSDFVEGINKLANSGIVEEIKRLSESGILSYMEKLKASGFEKLIAENKEIDSINKDNDDEKKKK